MKQRMSIVFGVVVLVAALLSLCGAVGWIIVNGQTFAFMRWAALLLFSGYAFRRNRLSIWILVGMFAGAEFGHDWPATAGHLQVFGTVFLRLVKVLIAPLLFGTLVMGIAGHPNLRKVGRMAVKTLLYFEIISSLALLIGFGAIEITHAGTGLHLEHAGNLANLGSATHSVSQLIENIFPESIAKSVAEGATLQIVLFSVFFGLALAMVPDTKRKPLTDFTESLAETMFKFTNLVMFSAPVGVFGAMASTVARTGMGVLFPLLKLLLTMYGAISVFVAFVLFPIGLLVQLPFRRFLQATIEPVTIAFATASSEAALPRAMEKLEAFGVARETVAFVLPTGYSFNLDGSSLYQSIAVVFVAQSAGISLNFRQQAILFLTLLVSSKGTAGVARASLIVVLGVAESFHLPSEPLFLLFAIDQLMDMARTALNVLGNCLATVVIARLEGEITIPS
jgi:proton glutamate symport protein